MPYSGLTAVSFHVDARIRHGEVLYVVGDVPALGSGDAAYGVPLVTTPEHFPEWFTQHPIPLVKGSEVNYMYAIFSGGSFSAWEQRSGTRTLKVEEKSQIVRDSLELDTASSQNETTFHAPFQKKLQHIRQDAGPQPSSFRDRRRQANDLEAADGLLIVCYHLPVKISKGPYNPEEDLGCKGHFENRAVPENGPEWEAMQKGSGGLSSELREERGASDTNTKNQANLRSWSSTCSGDRNKISWNIEWDESALLSRKKSTAADRMRVLFIGYPNCSEKILPSEQESLASALVRFRCVPVFLEPETRDLHYNVYCQGTLHKLFHHQVDIYANLPTRWWNAELHESSWIAYLSVNQSFAEKVVEVYNEGDIIWIQGYELLVLPSLLKRRLQAGHPAIGLFLHSPFPSSEIFRTLSVRDEILRGMLNADQIGFHLYEYARPFLSCCHRILGIQHQGNENDSRGGVLSLDYQGRRVIITVCHGGIEPEPVRATLSTPLVFSKARAIMRAALVLDKPVGDGGMPVLTPPEETARVRDQVIIVGLDESDYLRGIHHKLLSYESFLQEHPEWADRLCLIQVCILFNGEDSGIEMQQVTRRIARRINETFPRAPGRRPAVCLLEWGSCTCADRLALFSIADIFLNTPLRKGLDLQVFEFNVVADERKRVQGPWTMLVSRDLDPVIAELRREPTVILSEFTASFRVLPANMRCNPWRDTEVHQSLLSALYMGASERQMRNAVSLKYVNEHVETAWAQLVLTDLKNAVRSTGIEKKNLGLTSAGLGFGLQFRAIEFRPNFRHLSDDLMMDAYRNSSQRLIILDYGGTTVSDEYTPSDGKYGQNTRTSKFEFRFRPQGEAVVPGRQMIQTLQTLVADPCNTVFIVSGRERQELEAAFEEVEGIGLTAEHGCFYSWGNRSLHRVEAPFVRRASVEEPIPEEEPSVFSPKYESSQVSPLSRSASRPLVAVSATDDEASLPPFRRGRSLSLGTHGTLALRQDPLNRPREDFANEAEPTRKLSQNLRRSWVTLSDYFDDSWMELSEQIMDVYTQRTDGTYIERKGSSVVWQFRDAEPEFGALQAAELQDHLHGVLKAFPIEVVSGKGYVEVCPQGVDKGNACSHIIASLWPSEELPDFVLCLGDDIADEAMFEFFLELYSQSLESDDSQSEDTATESADSNYSKKAHGLGAHGSMDSGLPGNDERLQQEVSEHPKLFTCVVGEKPSVAQYYVNDVEEVGELLSVLARVSTKLEFSRSSVELRQLDKPAHPARKSLGASSEFSGKQSLQQGHPYHHRIDVSHNHSPNESTSVGILKPIAPNSSDGKPRAGSADSLNEEYSSFVNEPKEEADAFNVVAARAALEASRNQSFIDLPVRSSIGTRPLENKRILPSASMPVLSEFFSLDVSHPTSTTANEYLDLIADDEDDMGISF